MFKFSKRNLSFRFSHRKAVRISFLLNEGAFSVIINHDLNNT